MNPSVVVQALNEGWCPNAPTDDPGHCWHWWECEPCCRCKYDGGGEGCDCPRHNPDLYEEDGTLRSPDQGEES